jgi:hypothetical protein
MSAFALATVDGATEWEGNVGEKANAHEADLSVSADGSAVIVVGDETSEPGHPVAVVVAFSP